MSRRTQIIELIGLRKKISSQQIAEALGMRRQNVNEQLSAMRGADPALWLIHVVKWKAQVGRGGLHTPFFTLGPGPDAIKPRNTTNVQRQRRHRKKQRSEDKDFQRARERAQSWTPQRDPFITALFGEHIGASSNGRKPKPSADG